MLIYVTPVEDTDVSFLRSKLVEVVQDVPADARFLRMNLPGHAKPNKVRAETTSVPNIVRVINKTTTMVQLRVDKTFAVFEVADWDEVADEVIEKHMGAWEMLAEGDEIVKELADDLDVTPDELTEHALDAVGAERVATFQASELTFHESKATSDDHIGTLNLSPTIVDALEGEDIVFISDLRVTTSEELLAIEGVGPATLEKIQAALAEHDAA